MIQTKADTTVDVGRRAHYMDIHILRLSPDAQWIIDYFDRRRGEEFLQRVTRIRMPLMQPALWSGCRYTILYSKMVRFGDLCSISRYFAQNTARYISDVLMYGYDIRRLLRLVTRHTPNLLAVWASSSHFGCFDPFAS